MKKNKTMKKNENSVSESEQNSSTLTPGQPDIFNENPESKKDDGKISDDDFETQSEPLQFVEFDKGVSVTGTFCGTGKQIGEGKNAVKTWLLYEHENKKFVLVPQWDGLKKLGEITETGKKTVRIVYEGQVMDEKTPDKVKFHLVKLQFYQKETPSNLCVSTDSIRNILKQKEQQAV